MQSRKWSRIFNSRVTWFCCFFLFPPKRRTHDETTTIAKYHFIFSSVLHENNERSPILGLLKCRIFAIFAVVFPFASKIWQKKMYIITAEQFASYMRFLVPFLSFFSSLQWGISLTVLHSGVEYSTAINSYIIIIMCTFNIFTCSHFYAAL